MKVLLWLYRNLCRHCFMYSVVNCGTGAASSLSTARRRLPVLHAKAPTAGSSRSFAIEAPHPAINRACTYARQRLEARALRSFCIYAAAPLGETLHKNYQVACNTFLWCVLRKFWGGVSCLFGITSVFFLESIYALCMSYASALEAAKPAASPSGVVRTRGAMARRPLIDPFVLIHRNPHAWVGHVAASAAASLQPRRDTPLAD
jgi:hypothetical protein